MKEQYDEMKNPIQKRLKTDPIFKESYTNLKKAGIHIHSMVKFRDEWSNLSDRQQQIRYSYLSFCSFDEVERIVAPSDESDFLLQTRADSVSSNIRIFRTFQKRASNIKDSEWNLSSQFDDSIFKLFKNEVAVKYLSRIDEILYGTIYSDCPNGFTEQTNFGSRIIISEALNLFLYFMNLGFYNFWDDSKIKILPETKGEAILIGIRTMLLNESFDFELDPRGKVPLEIHQRLEQIVDTQLLFIIAHEYAHFLLNHLDNNSLVEKNIYNINHTDQRSQPITLKIYTQSQIKEFEADKFAIKILCDDDNNRKKIILLYTIYIMSFLDILASIRSAIKRNQSQTKTHPSPIERREKMMELGKKIWDKEQLEIAKETIRFSEIEKRKLIKHYSQHPSSITTYGSFYLTQWRDKKIIDRIDY